MNCLVHSEKMLKSESPLLLLLLLWCCGCCRRERERSGFAVSIESGKASYDIMRLIEKARLVIIHVRLYTMRTAHPIKHVSRIAYAPSRS